MCPAHALQAIPRHRKESGKRVLCSQARQKADCGKILVGRGRNFLGGGLACHILCPYLQAPPSYSRGPIASWMRRWASAFNPGLQIYVEARIHHRADVFFWSWVLSCFQGAELSRDPTIHTKSLNFHTHNQARFPGPEPQ